MKVINLSSKDPDIFQTNISPSRCDFVVSHFETFMQMYKSQRSTFWLRFLMSFKDHTEEKLYSDKKWLCLLMHYQYHFFKALNYVYVCIHKKFIEGSNTAVKKFINNLLGLALHSPSFLNFSSAEQWIMYLKSFKQIQTTFQNVSGIADPCQYGTFTLLIFNVYTDFFCALCSVFEQWCEKKDLSDEEFKKIDSKIIYWLPSFHSECKFTPLCFERYLLDYWKMDLKRLLLCDDIHNIFSSHNTNGCCENYIKEKNLINTFPFPSKHMMEIMEFISRKNDSDEEQDEDDVVSTITEVCLQELYLLKPQCKPCAQHEKCHIRIFHDEKCSEPYLCSGTLSCTVTCETNSKKVKKEQEVAKFWKNVSVDKFPIDENKSEASTSAESYDTLVETYLHAVENFDSDMQHFASFKHTYQCLSEFHKFDFNPRRTECLNRLRKKLTLKHPSNTYQFNFRQPFYRESLLENADRKMFKLQMLSCSQRNHNFSECSGQCFLLDVNSTASDSSNAFGRVISLTKTYVPVPPICHKHLAESVISECKCGENIELSTNEKKSDKSEENVKSSANEEKSNMSEEKTKMPSTEKKSDKCEEKIKPPVNEKSDECEEKIKASANEKKSDKYENIKPPANGKKLDKKSKSKNAEKKKNVTSKTKTTNCNKMKADEKTSASSDPVEETSVNDDGEIDEILKLMGMNDDVQTTKDDEAVENFFKLIGVNVDESNSQPKVNIDDKKLKMCAYCKKRETERKMFKKCSKCREENFPEQHYYCSAECLREDWFESHEKEHLKFRKKNVPTF